MTVQLKALREKRLQSREEMKALVDKRGRKEGDFTQTDREKFEALSKTLTDLNDQIELIERFLDLSGDEQLADDVSRNLSDDPQAKKILAPLLRKSSGEFAYTPMELKSEMDQFLASKVYQEAFRHAVINTQDPLIGGVERFLVRNECPEGITTGDFSQGGYLTTPLQIMAGIWRCCDKMVKMRQYARIFPVGQAISLGARKHLSDNSAVKWGHECAKPDAQAPTGNMKVLTPTILSGCTALCRELIRNTSDGVENYFVESLARTISEALEVAYLYGTGSGQPLGILTKDSLASNRYVPFDDDSTFTGDNLIDLLCNVPECYSGGNLVWFASRAMWCAILKLKTEFGYLWSATADRGLAVGAPFTLLGAPFERLEFMANYKPGDQGQEGTVPLLYGDMSQYWIADKNSVLVEREICVGTDQIAWYHRVWTDGMPMCDEAFSALLLTA